LKPVIIAGNGNHIPFPPTLVSVAAETGVSCFRFPYDLLEELDRSAGGAATDHRKSFLSSITPKM